MSELYTYDPKETILTVGGIIISGYADGEFLSVGRTNDTFSMRSGADGDLSRAKSNDKSGFVNITLAQTSPSNLVLSGFHKLDEESNAGVVPVLAKDLNGTSLFFSKGAWVRKPPDSPYAKEISDRAWVLDCVALEIVVGGTVPNSI